MLRIVICCGGGLSSSYIANVIRKQIKAAGLADQVSVTFSSMHTAGEKLSQYDVICCCPHLRYMLEQFIEKYRPQIPLYILPQRMYGTMNFEAIYQDVLDVVKIHEETGQNPVSFPNEDNFLAIKRDKSYRSIYGDYHQYIKEA